MKVLVACEFSGTVRDAFAAKGHDAWSCDLLPTEKHGNHVQGDVLGILGDDWDLMIAHPPCTHLAVCGAPSFKAKIEDGRQQSAIDFFMALANSSIRRIALENPVCIMSRVYRKPDQIVEPWYFRDHDSKKICLWLKNLPQLMWGELFSNMVQPEYRYFNSKKTSSGKSRYSSVHERAKSQRSRFFPGIAKAMAEQWGT